jgi:hypothetical protein
MTESSLDRAVEGLYRELKLANNDLSKIPAITRPITLLYMFQGMVDNGGFRYPMETDFPGNPPYSLFVDAYRQVGALEAAEALEKAVALFPFGFPEQNANARNQFMSSLGDDTDFEESEFSRLSDRVCGDETIWKRMDDYVAKHRVDFAPFITQ